MLPTITVDIGTTSIKLCVFDDAGELVAAAKQPTPTVRDAWGEVYDVALLEQHVTGFIESLAPDVRESVERIAIAGVGESGGLVAADGSLMSPMILWHDHRGVEWLDSLDRFTRDRLYAIAGLPASANYGISKVAWAVDQAGSAAAGAQWLNIAEYLAAHLTGERWSEYSLASRTMALDLETRTWSAEACEMFDLDIGRFPELRSGRDGAPLLDTHAQALGLSAGVMVHVAGHDHMVGAVGAGLESGELLNSTGTTEGLLFLTDAPALGPAAARAKLANGISPDGSSYTLFASIPTGGSAFATLQGLLGRSADDLIADTASLHRQYVDGSLDLDRIPLVLPRFRGSPPPTKDASALGSMARLRSDTTAEEIVFGCFLGQVLQFADVLDLFPVQAERVKVIGPASANPLWQQLKADFLGADLSASQFPEVVSRGAQVLASNSAVAWSRSAPETVEPDLTRRTSLHAWRSDVQTQWNHLKELPS